MMDWVRRNPVLAMLAGIAILLAAVIAGEALLSPERTAAVVPRKATPAEAKLLPPLAAISVDQAYPESAARPIFTPTRRPAPEAPASERNGFQKGQFVLLGVIAVGNNRTAMLREKATGKIHNVERGKEVNGIKVAEIDPEGVTLAVGADREVLPLSVQRTAANPASPGAAAANAAGPFAPPPPVGALTPGAAPPAPPTAVPVPGQPFVPPTPLQPGSNPITRAPGAEAAPLTPEELLARRRARRAGQGQAQ